MRVAVVGATGAVGSTILGVMRERVVPGRRDRAVRVRALGRAHDRLRRQRPDRQALTDESIQGFDLALFSAGSAHQRRVGAAVRRRRRRGRRQLVVLADVRRRAARRRRGQPRGARRPQRHRRQPELHDDADGRRAQADPRRRRHRAARGLDLPGRLRHRPARGRGAARPGAAVVEAQEIPAPSIYPHQIAFNVLPAGREVQGRRRLHHRGAQGDGARRARSWAAEDIRISATCARVPVYTGHSESVERADARGAVARRVPRAAAARARRDRGRRPGERRLPAADRRRRRATTCSSAGSAATRRTTAA